jgi:hypothetical protein
MRKIEVKIRQIIWAFKKSFKPTTYDLVVYQGKQYFIQPSFTGDDVWHLFDWVDNKPIHARIKGENLKVVQSAKRFINVFKQHLRFQKQNWESIDCGNPIGSRLCFNNSDDIYFG